jgi:hypothetical protein
MNDGGEPPRHGEFSACRKLHRVEMQGDSVEAEEACGKLIFVRNAVLTIAVSLLI